MNLASEARIRVATFADLDAVLLLDRAIDTLPHWAASDYLAALSEAADEPQRCLFVAQSGSQLAGLAVGIVNDIAGERAAELETVGVAQHMRRQGLGRELCLAVIAWSRVHGASHLDLEVRSRSSGPIALYCELGFKIEGNRRAYYRDPADDAILMRLDLKAGRSEPASLVRQES